MIQIKRTPEFDDWFDNIKDSVTKLRLVARLKKVSLGNLGDVKPVGDGIWEMREFFGAGYRMYYVKRGDILIIMLGGGDKSSQQHDIAQAKKLASRLDFSAYEQGANNERQ